MSRESMQSNEYTNLVTGKQNLRINDLNERLDKQGQIIGAQAHKINHQDQVIVNLKDMIDHLQTKTHMLEEYCKNLDYAFDAQNDQILELQKWRETIQPGWQEEEMEEDLEEEFGKIIRVIRDRLCLLEKLLKHF